MLRLAAYAKERAPMLVLSRKLNQSIVIGPDVRIVVLSVDRNNVRIGIEAPPDVRVHRAEIAAPRAADPAADASAAATVGTAVRPG